MSVVGVSAADFLKGAEVCKWIYEHCFDEANTADTRYRLFAQHVRGFGRTLETLAAPVAYIDSALGGHPSTHHDPPSPSHHASIIPSTLRRDFRQAVKDYTVTLDEARALLSSNRSLDRHPASFVSNMRWGLSTEAKCKDLQDRIAAHNAKVSLLLGTLQVLINTSFYDSLNAPPDLPATAVPPDLALALRSSLDAQLAKRSTSLRLLTHDEKLETLKMHWTASVPEAPASSSTGPVRTPTQLLSLRKLAWLIGELRHDEAFKHAPPGLPYRLELMKMQRSVSLELDRLAPSAVLEPDVESLDQSALRILPPVKPLTSTLAPPDERPWEKKLLELDLPDIPGCHRHALLVYRSGPQSLRLVREKVARDTNAVSRESESIQIFSDLLLPYYAAAQNNQCMYSMVFRNRTGTAKTVYCLADLAHAFALQRAVTGFRVLSDCPSVTLIAHRDWKRDIERQGRIQIWHLDPLSHKQDTKHNSSLNHGSPSLRSGSVSEYAVSEASLSNASSFAHIDRQDTRSSFASGSIISVGGDNVIATGSMPPPMIVVFAKAPGGFFEYMAIDLTRDLKRCDDRCECTRLPDQCLRLVLQRRSGAISARRFSTEHSAVLGPQLDRWNLAVLARLSAHTEERHPDCETRAMATLNFEYLALDFASVAARRKFAAELAGAAKVRDRADTHVGSAMRRAEHLAHKPREARRTSMAMFVAGGETVSMSDSQTTIRRDSTLGSSSAEADAAAHGARQRGTHHRRADSAMQLPELDFGREEGVAADTGWM